MARSDPEDRVTRRHYSELVQRHRQVAGDAPARRMQSALPADAVAIIEAPSRSVTQAGAARARQWLLRFQPRYRAFVDPLTGWTGGEEPLAHLAIRFPSRETAVRYAERHGLPYETREAAQPRRTITAPKAVEQQPPFQLCCWPTGPHALCCGNYPVLKERENGFEKLQ